MTPPQKTNNQALWFLRGLQVPTGAKPSCRANASSQNRQSILLLMSTGTVMINKTNILKNRTNVQWFFLAFSQLMNAIRKRASSHYWSIFGCQNESSCWESKWNMLVFQCFTGAQSGIRYWTITRSRCLYWLQCIYSCFNGRSYQFTVPSTSWYKESKVS